LLFDFTSRSSISPTHGEHLESKGVIGL
jgi:hypothetical protein